MAADKRASIIELLQQDHRVVAEVAAGAAVGFGHRAAQQALRAGLAPGVAAHHAGLAPLGRARQPALLEEARHRFLQHAVFVADPAGREQGQGHLALPAGQLPAHGFVDQA